MKKIDICKIPLTVLEYFKAKEYGMECKNDKRQKEIKKSYCYKEGEENNTCTDFEKNICND
jgi:hypothetical protein